MTEAGSPAPLRSAGVWFPPPLIFVLTFLAGWMIEKQWGRLTLTNSAAVVQALEVIGLIMLAAGIALVAWGIITFRRAKTAVYPNQPATTIVEAGPYRFTRNPMYSGLTIAYLGVAWMLNMGWPMILLPLALVVLHHFVIAREERYLASAFGETYESYRKRVNRWL